MISNKMVLEAQVITCALDWAYYQEPERLADQQTNQAHRRKALSAKLLLLCAIERYKEQLNQPVTQEDSTS